MPIYEYRCKSCGSVTEFLVGVGKASPIACSQCGSLSMEKIISPASFLERAPERKRGSTCCGREERCERPPFSTGESCRRG